MTQVLEYDQPHNARRLYDELIAALPELAPVDGVAVLLLSSAGTRLVVTVPDTVDPSAVDAVLAVHDPTPDPPPVTDFAGSVAVETVARTTDDQPMEAFRFPSTVKHVYKAEFEMMAVDAVSGATKNTEAKMTFKRTQAGLAQVGTTAIPYNAPDTATASWAIVPTVDGTDLVISVKGAAGRTVDWLLLGAIATYAPDGLES